MSPCSDFVSFSDCFGFYRLTSHAPLLRRPCRRRSTRWRAPTRPSATPRPQLQLYRVQWPAPRASKGRPRLSAMGICRTTQSKDFKILSLLRYNTTQLSFPPSHHHCSVQSNRKTCYGDHTDWEAVGGRPPEPGSDGVPGQHLIIGLVIEGQFSLTNRGMSGAGPHSNNRVALQSLDSPWLYIQPCIGTWIGNGLRCNFAAQRGPWQRETPVFLYFQEGKFAL